MASRPPVEEQIREFNRFYTEIAGALDGRHEGVDITLAQSRILISVRNDPGMEIGVLSDRLRLDPAFTSRTLGVLEDRGLIERSISKRDRRARTVTNTTAGNELIGEVEERSNRRARAMTSHLSATETRKLLAAMQQIHGLLSPPQHRSNET